MPRNHLPGASTLRNRNRITNKTRLKIHHGNLDVDALLIPDEDEEKNRLTNLVAGVDAEDANEHHLQAVLSASQRPHASSARRPGPERSEKVYIPTPDSTGVVQNYEASSKWKDPITYVSASAAVEESIRDGLSGTFTYFMDERDKEWLDRNNEEARGEGTSAQGAVSVGGTRASARSAKAKGKEPEHVQPVVVTEDELELVMGMFEKLTHEKTEFLHHGLENGMAFPPFSDYQETFSSPLLPLVFSNFSVPSWIPQPSNLLRIAKVVYPYWKERRIERGGHRIIPILNNDETDTQNESYICFRRREIKAVRKTRASQATSSDKLARLNVEFQYPLELAKAILSRENSKRDLTQQSQVVWEKRVAVVDLKRKFPSLGDKGDEELLIDKERPAKKPELSRLPIKLRANDAGAPSRIEIAMKPRERAALIREQIDRQLARQKDLDHHWEDSVDNPYQPLPIPYSSRLFKYIPPPHAPSFPSDSDEEPTPRQPRAIRYRIGRGGSTRFDRRHSTHRAIARRAREAAFISQVTSAAEGESEDEEDTRRLEERWRYDFDDGPAYGSQGADEQDRVLVDDYNPKHISHTSKLIGEAEQHSLFTDPSIPVPTPEGRYQTVIPYRLGMVATARRDQGGAVRGYPPPGVIPPGHPGLPHPPAPGSNGTPISVQHQVKKMPPPTSVPQMRISSNGGMRPPTVPAAANLPAAVNMQTSSNTPAPAAPTAPPQVPSVVQHPTPALTNGVGRAAITMPHVEPVKLEALVNGPATLTTPSDATGQVPDVVANGTSNRPKSQNQVPVLQPNGYHLLANYQAALANPVFAQYMNGQHSGLTLQQMQNLKATFATLPAQDLAAMQSVAGRPLQGAYMHLANARNLNVPLSAAANNLKLPTTQPLQWTGGSPLQRPASAVNGVGVNGINGLDSQNLTTSVSPTNTPARTSSANGTRQQNGVRPGILPNGQMPLSPHLQHSPSPMSSTLSQSPPRLPMTPTLGLPSPSLQHQQPIGNPQTGF
ncbi:hypothetical protein M378DRAFT_170023 [Amanita muscaria Koide BX008]|uniref:Enhancer of polycomb-like protein n=1 Tax=Amanita muscaria (strain Koide BX008) TaxID=946122 RepID=A0A0C2WQD9_AMAMK|nr:hypothetical protein M378DRAFT_170023 [Amanita muscaria Koide BX008]